MENNYDGKVMKYQLMESESIDDFILSHLTKELDANNKIHAVIIKMMHCVYYTGSIIFNSRTPGQELMLISLNKHHTKTHQVLYYLFKLLFPSFIHRYPLLKIFYYLIDLRHYLKFLSYQGNEGIGLSIFDRLFDITYHSDSLISSTITNSIIMKNLLWKELSNLIIFLFPKLSFGNKLIGTKEKSYLCQICKEIPTNCLTFPCQHKFCYYCYMSHSNKLSQEDQCIICNSI